MKKVTLIILVIILFVLPLIPWGYSIVKDVQFSANCGEYLKLAADANDVDMAEKHLTTAIDYLEANDLTSGHTKIFVYRPSNDIGLWYENLKVAQTQLQEMQKTEYTELEQSNMLMKLRETILDDGGSLTKPIGIALVPVFTLIFWLNCLLWLPCWVIGGVTLAVAIDEL
jgi:hypothetical protein